MLHLCFGYLKLVWVYQRDFSTFFFFFLISRFLLCTIFNELFDTFVFYLFYFFFFLISVERHLTSKHKLDQSTRRIRQRS